MSLDSFLLSQARETDRVLRGAYCLLELEINLSKSGVSRVRDASPRPSSAPPSTPKEELAPSPAGSILPYFIEEASAFSPRAASVSTAPVRGQPFDLVDIDACAKKQEHPLVPENRISRQVAIVRHSRPRSMQMDCSVKAMMSLSFFAALYGASGRRLGVAGVGASLFFILLHKVNAFTPFCSSAQRYVSSLPCLMFGLKSFDAPGSSLSKLRALFP